MKCFLSGATFLLCLFLWSLLEGQDSPGKNQLQHCKPGPWGELEYFPTYLEAPDHIMEAVNTPSEKTVWVFPNKDTTEVSQFLRNAGISEGEVSDLIAGSVRFQSGSNYKVFPSSGFIRHLSPNSRKTIYDELRKHRENKYHFSPIIIESGNVKEWLADLTWDSEAVALFERLCYPIGTALAFSDLPVFLSRFSNEKDERKLLKSLTRTRSLIVRLKVGPQSDFNALKEYWTVGYKQKDILPLLESYGRSPGINRIDIAHLLPPTPRKYLYTFPTIELGADGVFPDCFWISLNFFHYIPSDEFNSIDSVKAELQKNYIETRDPRRFGDILMIANKKTGKVIHACVFIADEIVYTKNGRSILRPFLLMKLSDLLVRFGDDDELLIRTWRNNPSNRNK